MDERMTDLNIENTNTLTSLAQVASGYLSDVDLSSEQTLVDIFNAAVSEYGDRPAFSCMGKTLSFNELNRLTSAFAAYLQSNTTLVPGDRLAVQLPNLLQYPLVLFGALKAGLVVVNVNPMYTARELKHQLNDAGVKAMVVFTLLEEAAKDVIPKTGIEYVIATDPLDLHIPFEEFGQGETSIGSIPNAIPLQKILSVGDQLPAVTVWRSENDLAVLQYTGGTTGVSKGVMLSHRNLRANMLQMNATLEGVDLVPGEETVIAPLPLYHIYTFTVICLGYFSQGHHSVLIPDPRNIEDFSKQIKGYRFSAFMGINTLFTGLSRSVDFKALDFSNLKYTLSGGMALTPEVAQRWQELTGCPINEGYGLSETSPAVSVNPRTRIKLGTIGVPVPGTKIKIIDADGNAMSPGDIGELCVKGPQVMQGYWQRPDETRKVLSDDGWLKTGDMAYVDSDGYISIADRKKDMVIVSGFNVYPNEIEQVVAQCPGIVECAAIGVDDDKSGEAVMLVAVADDKDLDEEKVIAHCRESLSGYKVPRHVVFTSELPKSNVGKILRREIREIYAPVVA